MKFVIPLLAASFLLAGCSKSSDTADAVKAGIIRDLSNKVDVNNMDVSIASVSFRGSLADANVMFTPKGQPGGGMTMKYTLEKKSDGWHILRRQGDAAAHGGAAAPGSGIPGGAMPGGIPGAQPGEGGDGRLPPNHPRVDGMPPATNPPSTQR